MKQYKAGDHAKLRGREQQFIDFMHTTWSGYIDDDNLISAHSDGDFGWFVGEFMNHLNSKKKNQSKEQNETEQPVKEIMATTNFYAGIRIEAKRTAEAVVRVLQVSSKPLITEQQRTKLNEALHIINEIMDSASESNCKQDIEQNIRWIKEA